MSYFFPVGIAAAVWTLLAKGEAMEGLIRLCGGVAWSICLWDCALCTQRRNRLLDWSLACMLRCVGAMICWLGALTLTAHTSIIHPPVYTQTAGQSCVFGEREGAGKKGAKGTTSPRRAAAQRQQQPQ